MNCFLYKMDNNDDNIISDETPFAGTEENKVDGECVIGKKKTVEHHVGKNKYNRNSLIFSLPNIGKSVNRNYNRISSELNKILLSDKELENESPIMTQVQENQEDNHSKRLSENLSKISFITEKTYSKLEGLFSKQPEDRTFSDLSTIKNYLALTNLSDYFQHEKLLPESLNKMLVLCGVEMRLSKHVKGETIFKIGEKPQFFYLILKGEVSILKPFPYKKFLNGFEYFSHLMMLKNNGDVFLFTQTIQANKKLFPILNEDISKIHFIFITNVITFILNGNYNNLTEMIKLCGLSKEDIGIPEKYEINQISFIHKIKSKIDDALPFFTKDKLAYYSFLQNKIEQYEVTLYRNEIFMTKTNGEFFGDSAFDKGTTRNATVITTEDTNLLYLDSFNYCLHLQKEKQIITNKEVNFLQQNYFFNIIQPKTFEKKYYNYFIYENKEKGDVICNEKEQPKFIYFIRKGEVSLYSSRSIIEIHDLLSQICSHNESVGVGKQYSKLKSNANDFISSLKVKKMNKIFVLRNIDTIGVESAFYGFPYIATAIVSSEKAVIVKINFSHLKHIFKEEANSLAIIKKAADKKLSIFYDRFFSINNTKLNLADSIEYYNQCNNQTNKDENIKIENVKKSLVNEINKKVKENLNTFIKEKETDKVIIKKKKIPKPKEIEEILLPVVHLSKSTRNKSLFPYNKPTKKHIHSYIDVSNSLSTKNITNTYENNLIKKLKREIKNFSSEFITSAYQNDDSSTKQDNTLITNIKQELNTNSTNQNNNFSMITQLPSLVNNGQTNTKIQTNIPIKKYRKKIDFSKPYMEPRISQKLKKYNDFYNFDKKQHINNNSYELDNLDNMNYGFSRQKILSKYFNEKTKEYLKYKKNLEQQLLSKYGDA